MKHRIMIALACLTLAMLATTASAQPTGLCPYTTTFTKYGNPCSSVSLQLPELAPFSSGPGCEESIAATIPVVCCNVLLTNRWLVAGVAPINAPLPGGCPLLASPDIIIDLPPLEGQLVLTLLLPPDPGLIGLSLYLQHIDRRLITVGGVAFSTSNGLKLSFQ